MASIDFTHSGPHDDLALAPASMRRSEARNRVRHIAATAIVIAIGIAFLAVRYWLYLPLHNAH